MIEANNSNTTAIYTSAASSSGTGTQPADPPLGWAVVGLGVLALDEILPALQECQFSAPVALISDDREKAQEIAADYDIDEANLYDYDNFDEIADNPAIDVVYIVLPNSMHAEYTIRALRAGKHVLCEKPMAPTVTECEQMIAAAEETGRKLMIAYRLHYEPFNQRVMALCQQKALGPIRTFASSNCQNVDAPNIRLEKALGGGPVQDVGIYSINAARYVTGEEPVEVVAFADQPADDPRFEEVPASVSFLLRFPSGVLAHCDCSFASTSSQRYRVHCQSGYIEMDPAFAYSGLALRIRDDQQENGDVTPVELPQINQFAAEMDHFADCILNDKKPRTPGAEGLADIRIIVAIEEAIRTGRAVRVGR